MKKRLLLFLLIFSLVLVNLSFVAGQQAIPENIPGGEVISGFGGIDPDTGLPSKFSEFKSKADELSTREQNSSYLRKEWTKVLAANKVFGPILFYTNKFFSFFDPLWKFSFGKEFVWSLAFFSAMFIWGVLVIIIYYPAKAVFDQGRIVGIIAAIAIASLAGSTGIIKRATDQIDVMLTNIWIFVVAAVIVIILIAVYIYFFRGLEIEAAKRELELAKKATKARGKMDMEALAKYSAIKK